MFSVTGLISGVQYTLNYEDGVLSGDPIAMQKAFEENKKKHGPLGMPPCIKENYLEYETSAHMLVTAFVFDKIISRKNDYKPIPEGCDI